jgi:hypothetical protein
MRTSLVALFLLLLVSIPVYAQERSHPNFTGIWKLDPNRSTLNGAQPENVTLYIHQNDPDFHLRRTEVVHGKSNAWSVHGRTDGKTMEKKSREGTQRAHMYWQGSQLVLELKRDGKSGESRTTVRYSMADDGHTLIAQEKQNDQDSRWVFRKTG